MTTQPSPTTYDILITGGRVIDPAQGLDGQLDVAIAGGRIARIEAGINPGSALRTLDASGRIVTPGLIDLHTHVAGGLRKPVGEDVMVSADVAGVHSGITTVLDAGSTGALNVAGLINYTAALSKTRVLCLLNVGSLGVTRAPEVRHPSDIDHDASVGAILARPDVVRGVKLRMVSPAVAEMGMDLPRAAKAIASEAGVPMMVHVGDIMGDNPVAGELAPRLLSEVLTRGDIVTHTLSFHIGALLAGDDLLQEARDARERGVVFDVGVGKANFSFDSAKKVLDQGFIPDTLSSDITLMSRFAGPTHSLAECMGKLMSLGIGLTDVIRMTTSRPAEVLGLEGEIGTLEVGRVADVSILEAVEGNWLFRDITGGTQQGSTAIRPWTAIRAGEVMPLDYGPRPWGWLPESEG